MGISQPPKVPRVAPALTCTACRGPRCRSGVTAMERYLPGWLPWRPAQRVPIRRISEEITVITATVDALVVGTVYGEDGPHLLPGNEEVDAAFDGALIDVLKVLGARGKADEVIKVPTRRAIGAPLLVATGLGEVNGKPSGEQVRRAAGAASRALSGTSRAITTLSRIDLAAAAEGTALGCYMFTAYRSHNGDAPLSRMDLSVPSANDRAAEQDLAKAVAM